LGQNEFKLSEAPSTAASCMWLKSDAMKALLDFLAAPQAPMQMNGAYKPQHPIIHND